MVNAMVTPGPFPLSKSHWPISSKALINLQMRHNLADVLPPVEFSFETDWVIKRRFCRRFVQRVKSSKHKCIKRIFYSLLLTYEIHQQFI